MTSAPVAQFLGRLLRGDRRRLEEHADFDELPCGEGFIDLFIEGFGQAALADLENGVQMVGLCPESRSFFTGQMGFSFCFCFALAFASLLPLLRSCSAFA